MTKWERDLLRLVNRHVAGMQPMMAAAWRATFALLAKEIGTPEAVRLIQAGGIDAILTDETMERVTAPLRKGISQVMDKGVELTLNALPKSAKQLVFFDVASPRVRAELDGMKSKAMNTIRKMVRKTVTETLAAGLEEGLHPTAIGRTLRETIGIAANQAQYTRNLARDLRAGKKSTLNRKLLNQNTARSLRAMLDRGEKIPEARIKEVVDAYYTRYRNWNTDVNARQFTLDAYRRARKEAYVSAQERKVFPAGYEAMKEWVHFDPQKNPRPIHVAMSKLPAVPINQPYANGDMVAGDGEYNCRCMDRYFIRKRRILALRRAA